MLNLDNEFHGITIFKKRRGLGAGKNVLSVVDNYHVTQ